MEWGIVRGEKNGMGNSEREKKIEILRGKQEYGK